MKERSDFIPRAKKFIIAIAVVLLAAAMGIIYYSVRLPSTSVIAHSTKIERISFLYLKGTNMTPYLIEFEDQNAELNQWMSILDSVSYTRSPRAFFSKNIRNDGGPTFAFIIFYRDRDGEINDYFLDINQKGYVLRGGKKIYKMVDREAEVFDQLSTWLFEKAVRMPVT
ncbi:hypothetical protein [Paenibacillus lautus]|uniref:hypothetical protein n=1 Tax=Paenibacillus lautus TaxID=1401 RepID=UPI000FD94292|nr:hypothetical protein [Paenibacillus lautus]